MCVRAEAEHPLRRSAAITIKFVSQNVSYNAMETLASFIPNLSRRG